jgi:hypothetical protein
MAGWMNARRDDDIGIPPANVYAVARAIRGRTNLLILRPFVQELIPARCDIAQPFGNVAVLIFHLSHCAGIVHVHSEETGLRAADSAPIAAGILPHPCLNLRHIGRSTVLPLFQERQLVLWPQRV